MAEPGLFEASLGGEPVAAPASPAAAADSDDSPGLFESSTSVAVSDEGQSVAAPHRKFGFEIHGHVRGGTYIGKSEGENSAEVKAGFAEADVKLSARVGQWGRAFAEMSVRPAYEAGEWDADFDLDEAYVDLYLGRFDFRLGHQIIVWGRADGINPTNVLTPSDLAERSPYDVDHRKANFGLRTHLNLQPVRIEAVWLPLYRATRLPDVPLDPYVELTEPKLPSRNLKNGTLAGKIHLELPSFETSVSYVFGHPPLPGYAVDSYTIAGADSAIRIARTPYRQHLAGFDFSTAVGRAFGLRGEVAYRHPLDSSLVEAPNPDLQYVLGIDREFGPVSVIAQYYGRYVFDWEAVPVEANPFDVGQLGNIPEPVPAVLRGRIEGTLAQRLGEINQLIHNQRYALQHSVSLRFEWLTLHDNLSISAFALANLTTRDWLIYPKVSYSIADGLVLAVGAEIYLGPEGSLLGLAQDLMSAGYLDLKYSF